MSIATVKELRSFMNKGGRIFGLSKDSTDAAIIQWEGKLKQAALDNVQACKTNRPWTFVDFNLLLKADQPWLGWEWETGTDDKATYEKMIDFLWDGFTHVAIDREGSGQYPFEIAFPPENLSAYKNGSTAIQKYATWLNEQGIKQANNPTTYSMRAIGMHVNISTPLSRKKRSSRTVALKLINLLQLGEKQETELYGRYQRFWNLCQARGDKGQFEFKMFASTSDLATIKKYQVVANKLPALIDCVIEGKQPTNVYNYLSGKEELKCAC